MACYGKRKWNNGWSNPPVVKKARYSKPSGVRRWGRWQSKYPKKTIRIIRRVILTSIEEGGLLIIRLMRKLITNG